MYVNVVDVEHNGQGLKGKEFGCIVGGLLAKLK